MRFSFSGGVDVDKNGRAADIMFDGTIVKDDYWGHLPVADDKGAHWLKTSWGNMRSADRIKRMLRIVPNNVMQQTLEDPPAVERRGSG